MVLVGCGRLPAGALCGSDGTRGGTPGVMGISRPSVAEPYAR